MIEHVFQILITEKPALENRFSDDLVRNIASLKSIYPKATYKRYEHDEIVAFLEQHFPKDVIAAYHGLVPYAFKADLARYCLLHEFGGLYSDLSYLHLHAITPEKDTTLVTFRDIPEQPPWATSNAIIYAKPKTAALGRAIDRIVENHQARYYGLSPLDPTGPNMFGRVLSEGEDWDKTVLGESRLISREKTGRVNILKILPCGSVIALRNKINNCSIDEMVDGHTNNYSELWNAKRIWGEVGFLGRLQAKMSSPALPN